MLNYPFKPHETNLLDQAIVSSAGSDAKTQEEIRPKAESICEYYLDRQFINFINDAVHIAVINGIKHVTDLDTLALANSRIPRSVNDDTLRFLIAVLYEKSLEFPILWQRMIDSYYYSEAHKAYLAGHYITQLQRDIPVFIKRWVRRAQAIVDIMKDASTKVGELSRNPDFIRDAALIEVGEKTGLQMTTAGNTVTFGIPVPTGDVGQRRTFYSLVPNTSFNIAMLDDARFPTQKENATDTLTITAKNGPSEIRVRSTTSDVRTVLVKDASRTFTNAEMMANLTSTPIVLPVAARTLPNVADLEVGSDESVDIANLFTGIRINVTAASANTRYVTVRVNETATSMGITGVRRGKTTITVTGTNEAGATSVTFDVTVVERS